MCPNALWVLQPSLPCMPQTARLVYRCVFLCGKTHQVWTPSHHITVPSFPHKVHKRKKMELRRHWKSGLPLHFLYMAHLVIRVVGMLIALSCNLAKFHISVKSYKALIVQSKLQSYISSLSFQSDICLTK